MPYISDDAKELLHLQGMFSIQNSAGDLNYVLTNVIKEYLNVKGLQYQTLNDISGALTECLAEFRRRIIVPYEDTKIALNGDVY